MMEVTKIFEDALKYPTKDFNKLLILGVLAIVALIPMVLVYVTIFLSGGFNIQSLSVVVIALGILTALFLILLEIIYGGYGLSITRKTIALEEEIPDFDWIKNIIDGLKVLILGIIYSIIPAIVAGITGFFVIGPNIVMGSFQPSPEMFTSLISSFLVVGIVWIILAIIFQLFYLVSVARLAETDSLVDALNIINIFDKIGEIGWGNYIIWVILAGIILFVISAIMSVISIIPIVGSVIVLLLGTPYILMFSSRALGLIYNESKNN